MNAKHQRIPEDLLAETWYAFMHELLNEVQRAYRRAHDNSEITQKDIANRLGKSEGFISRCLHGKQNMTVRTMNKIARAMDCRLKISLQDLNDLTMSNAPPEGRSWEFLITNDDPNTSIERDDGNTARSAAA